MDPSFVELVKSGGSVLIALAVIVGIIYLGHRFIWLPSQKQNRAIAESQAEAAKSHAEAARAHAHAARSNEEAARFNSITSEANSRTAAHLERLTEMVLSTALGQKRD
jgi:predicted lipid-binding transport protein (Tim44 family)